MSVRYKEHYFVLLQYSIVAIIVTALWLAFRRKTTESAFRVREADRTPPKGTSRSGAGHDELAHAKLKRHEALQLPGIRIDGTPHEILGVPPTASQEQIQKAYRDLMKRYHPDKIGRPGSREWTDAQKIAEALNQAKDSLLKRR